MVSSVPSQSPSGSMPWRRRALLARRTLRRLVLRRRRLLAATLTAVAVLAILRVLAPPPAPTQPVVVAARDLPGGVVLTAGDLTVVDYPVGIVPAGLLADPAGRTLAGPMRRGEPVSDRRVVGPALAAGHPGRVAMPVRIPDAASVGLLRVGDRIDLVSADPRRGSAQVLVRAAAVLALPEEPDTSLPGRLVVAAVPPDTVTTLSATAARGFLSLTLSG